MNIRYFFYICTIITSLITVEQANSRTIILEPTPVVSASQTASYLYLNGLSDTTLHDAMLQKIAFPFVASVTGMLWKGIVAGITWKNMKDMYTNGESLISFLRNGIHSFINDIDTKLETM